ncbi:hypothetical protein GCM10011320_21750 [Neoroseomonas lacus]|uniref:Uncharacterized protein n=2 Tax=Neoroseomonas lacus TaxID=287609 RepID=A0A917KHC8_9PROT|nr:hypothetical protein GCM10011320_21750 [Neoroseomonas lacus]
MYRNPITGQDNPIVRTCFTNFDPGNPSEAPGNYVDIGLTITDDRQGGITLGIGPASVGLAGKWSRTVGNSLVVYFAQPGLDTVQAASDHARAACRDGQQTSTACDRARWSLFQIVNGSIPSVGNGTGVMRGRFRTTTPASAPVPPQNTPPAGRPPTPGASNGCDDGEGDNRAVGVHRRNLPRC